MPENPLLPLNSYPLLILFAERRAFGERFELVALPGLVFGLAGGGLVRLFGVAVEGGGQSRGRAGKERN